MMKEAHSAAMRKIVFHHASTFSGRRTVTVASADPSALPTLPIRATLQQRSRSRQSFIIAMTKRREEERDFDELFEGDSLLAHVDWEFIETFFRRIR